MLNVKYNLDNFLFYMNNETAQRKKFKYETLLFKCYILIHSRMDINIIHIPNCAILGLKIIIYVKACYINESHDYLYGFYI